MVVCTDHADGDHRQERTRVDSRKKHSENIRSEDFEIINVNGDGLITKTRCKICSKHISAKRSEARSKYTNNVSHLRVDRVSLNRHFMFTARKKSVFSSNPNDPKFEFSMFFFVINIIL